MESAPALIAAIMASHEPAGAIISNLDLFIPDKSLVKTAQNYQIRTYKSTNQQMSVKTTNTILLLPKSKPTQVYAVHTSLTDMQLTSNKNNLALKLNRTATINHETIKANAYVLHLSQAQKTAPKVKNKHLLITTSTSSILPLLNQLKKQNYIYVLYKIKSAKGLVDAFAFTQKHGIGLVVDATAYTEINWLDVFTNSSEIGIYFTKQQQKKSSTKLHALRAAIETCDKEMIQLLDKRMQLVNKIGRLKKQQNLPVFQPAKFLAHVLYLNTVAKNTKLNTTQIITLYQALHELAVEQQG